MTLPNRSKILGLSTLFAVSLLLLAAAYALQLPRAAFWILIWVGAESLMAFYGLAWSLNRSNRTFLSIFFGGTLLRLVSIGIAAALLVTWQIPPAIPLLSLVTGYFVLSMVQLPFIS